LSDIFAIRKGLKKAYALSPLVFNFVLEHAIRRVQVNQDGLKQNGAYQLLVYADDINILRTRVNTNQKNTEVFAVATNENGLELNADKTKYMIMSQGSKC
jgi:hypothetical protein